MLETEGMLPKCRGVWKAWQPLMARGRWNVVSCLETGGEKQNRIKRTQIESRPGNESHNPSVHLKSFVLHVVHVTFVILIKKIHQKQYEKAKDERIPFRDN